MDGHPDILLLQYDTFSNNLLGYCMRLSVEKSENILSDLESMLQEELGPEELRRAFPAYSKEIRVVRDRVTVHE